jgi:hypothetical protein
LIDTGLKGYAMTGATIREILRSGASIIVGYAILAMTNMAFVMIWYVRPIAMLDPLLILSFSIVYNFVCSVGAGFVVAMIAGRLHIMHATIAASMMAIVTIISMVIDIAVEPLSYKIAYFAVMLAGTILGGYSYAKRGARQLQQNAS